MIDRVVSDQKGGDDMKKIDDEMWQINIEDAVSRICLIYGTEVATSVFQRYGAHNFEDLNPCFYADVFGDLEFIANDN